MRRPFLCPGGLQPDGLANRHSCLACAAQAEKDLCDPTALDSCNVTAYQAKYPTAINGPVCTGSCGDTTEFDANPIADNCPAGCTFGGVERVTSDIDTTVVTQIELKPKSWTFLTATVGAGVPMYHAKYSVGAAHAVLGALFSLLGQPLICMRVRAV